MLHSVRCLVMQCSKATWLPAKPNTLAFAYRYSTICTAGLLLHTVLGPDLERFGETQTKLQNMVERAQRLLASTAAGGDESAAAGLAKDSKKGSAHPKGVNTPTSAMASQVPAGLLDSSAAFADGGGGPASSSEHAEAIETIRADANRAIIGELLGGPRLCAAEPRARRDAITVVSGCWSSSIRSGTGQLAECQQGPQC